jgi:hypothetical protein
MKFYAKDIRLSIHKGRQSWMKNRGAIRIIYSYHRGNDKPAITWGNGIKQWFKMGLRHRENNKPIVVEPGGEKYYEGALPEEYNYFC